MSIEELLKPRVKIIAPWPKMGKAFKVGEILTFEEESTYFVSKRGRGISNFEIDNCKANFRKLEWWEERRPEDMPQYVKLDPKKEDDYFIPLSRIFKVYKWDEGFAYIDPKNKFDLLDNRRLDFIPATEAEYLNYQNQNK